MTSLSKAIEVINKIAPPELAEADDKIGMQIGPIIKRQMEKKIVRQITVALDPGIDTIQFAIENKCQLIITHHPLFWGPIGELTGELLKKVRMCTSNYINLYVTHTNWDSAENGTNDTIIDILGLNKIGTFNMKDKNNKEIPIGRFCTPRGTLMSLKLLLEIIQDKINPQHISYVGNKESEINKIVVIAGGGGDKEFLMKAIKNGADTFITGEASYHSFRFANENDLNLITLGHYETENPGMKRLSQILQMELPKAKIKFFQSKPTKKYI